MSPATARSSKTTWCFGHLFNLDCYFIERPGVYTKQELLQWKQLEAHNYFMSGYVRTVEIWDLRTGQKLAIMRAYVNPSQCSPHKAHHAWVVAKADGQILTTHCTCMAG